MQVQACMKLGAQFGLVSFGLLSCYLLVHIANNALDMELNTSHGAMLTIVFSPDSMLGSIYTTTE